MFNDHDFGYDRFVYIDGVRHRTVLARTLLPLDSETNAHFEERMGHIASQLATLGKVKSVEVQFQRRAGAIVECLVIVTHDPYPEYITGDERPAGGRPNPRGKKAA